MKIGRYEFNNITPADRILDNGAVYQMITRTFMDGWYNAPYKISKTAFESLLKMGLIATNDDLAKEAADKYGSGVTLWAFTANID